MAKRTEETIAPYSNLEIEAMPEYQALPERLKKRAMEIVAEVNPEMVTMKTGVRSPAPIPPKVPISRKGLREPPEPKLEEMGVGVDTSNLPFRQRYEQEKKALAFLKEGTELTFFDKLGELANNPSQIVPFLSSGVETYNLSKLIKAGYDFKTGQATPEQMELLTDFANRSSMDKTFGYKVMDTIARMPAFAGELLATSGLFNFVRKGIYQAGAQTLEKIVKNKALLTAGQIGLKTIGAGTATVYETMTSGLARVVESSVEQLLPEIQLDPFDKENVVDVLVKHKGDIIPAVVNGFGNQWMEILSERSGLMFSKMAEPVRNLALKTGILKQFLKLNPGSTAYQFNEILKNMGWNGIVGEMMEERAGEIGRAVLFNQPYHLPTPDQLATELVAFSIPMVGQYITSRVMNQQTGAGPKGQPYTEGAVPEAQIKPVEQPQPTPTTPTAPSPEIVQPEAGKQPQISKNIITGWHTTVSKGGEQTAEMQSSMLPRGYFIALDRPFESEVHDKQNAKRVEHDISGMNIYNPDGMSGFPKTKSMSDEILAYLRKDIKGDVRKNMTTFLNSKGYDGYVRGIDGQRDDRELILFPRKKNENPENVHQENIDQKTFMRTEAKVLGVLKATGRINDRELLQLKNDEIRDGNNIRSIINNGIKNGLSNEVMADQVNSLMIRVEKEGKLPEQKAEQINIESVQTKPVKQEQVESTTTTIEELPKNISDAIALYNKKEDFIGYAENNRKKAMELLGPEETIRAIARRDIVVTDKNEISKLKDVAMVELPEANYPKSIIKPDTKFNIAKIFSGQDDTRYVLNGVMQDGVDGAYVATDGRRLIVIPDNSLKGKPNRNVNVKDGTDIEGDYPNFRQVFPSSWSHKAVVDADRALRILTASKNAKKLTTWNTTIFNMGEEEYTLNSLFVLDAITALKKSGAKEILIFANHNKSPVVFKGDNGVSALVMPMKSKDPIYSNFGKALVGFEDGTFKEPLSEGNETTDKIHGKAKDDKPSHFGMKRQQVEQPEQPLVESGEIIKRSNIINELSNKLKIPIRYKRFGGTAKGIFKPGNRVIRLKSDYATTMAHEVGHVLTNRFKNLKALISGDAQLKDLDYDKERKDTDEGWSEFLRLYITGKSYEGDADIEGIPFYGKFQEWMKANPEIQSVIESARKEYTGWKNMPLRDRFESTHSFGKAETKPDIGEIATRAYTDIVDKLYPLKKYTDIARRLTGNEVEESRDVYEIARLYSGWSGKADAKLAELKEILTPVKGSLKDLSVYLSARRQAWLANNRPEIKTEFSKKQLNQIVSEYENEHGNFKDIADSLYKYQDALLENLVSNGVMDQDTYNRIKSKSGDYVPLQRVMDGLDSAGYLTSTLANVRNPVKKIKGSEREVIDPLESIFKNTYLLIQAVERNNVGKALVKLSQTSPELGKLVEQVPHRYTVQRTKIADIMQALKKQMGDDAPELPDDAMEKTVNIFRPLMYSKDENVITVLQDGKPVEYFLDKDIYRAMMNMDTEQTTILTKILQPFATVLRAGATTISPDFPVRNFMRDQATAWIFSKHGYTPFVGFVKGLFSYFKKDAMFKEFQQSGAVRSSLVSLDRKYIRAGLGELMKPKQGNIIDLLSYVSEISEVGTRLGAYITARNRGASVQKSAMEARDITLDFQRQGAKMIQANKIIAFLTANINGMMRPIEELRRNQGKFFAKSSVLTALSLGLWFLQKDDDRYKQIPQWQKDIFWIIVTPKTIFRIPKPPGLGQIFGTIPELIAEKVYRDDPKFVMNLMRNLVQTGPLSLDIIPAAVKPVLENIMNYSTFRKQPIESEAQKKMLPQDRYNLYTSETVKAFSRLFNVSPVKVENLIQGYTASAGTAVLNIIDMIIGAASGKRGRPIEPAGIPFVRAFTVREPIGTYSKSMMDFYENWNKIQQAQGSFKQGIKRGNVDEARRIYEKYPVRYYKVSNRIGEKMQKYNKLIKTVIRSEMSDSDKLVLIRKYGQAQTELADGFNKLFWGQK